MIQERLSPAYGPGAGNTGFHAMACEFEFTTEQDPPPPAQLSVNQARPYPGRGN